MSVCPSVSLSVVSSVNQFSVGLPGNPFVRLVSWSSCLFDQVLIEFVSQPFCLSVCLSVSFHMSDFLSIHLSVCLSVIPYVWLSVHLCVHPSVWLSVHLSDCLFICLSVRQFFGQSARQSVCPSVSSHSCLTDSWSNLSPSLSVCLSVCLCVCQCVGWSARQSVCPSVSSSNCLSPDWLCLPAFLPFCLFGLHADNLVHFENRITFLCIKGTSLIRTQTYV